MGGTGAGFFWVVVAGLVVTERGIATGTELDASVSWTVGVEGVCGVEVEADSFVKNNPPPTSMSTSPRTATRAIRRKAIMASVWQKPATASSVSRVIHFLKRFFVDTPNAQEYLSSKLSIHEKHHVC